MFEQAKKLIKESKTIYIVGHVNPDGDSIGSAFALYIAMEKLGKSPSVIMKNYSNDFKFLPRIKEAVDSVEKPEYDLLISVDSSDKERLDISKEDIMKAKNILMIDHHKMSCPYGNVNCIKENSASNCEIIFSLLDDMKVDIDKDIATYLYTGIMTDTGSFNYSSTTPETMIIVSKLMQTGIDFSNICKKLNWTKKEEKLKLIAKTIDKMEVYLNGQVRYSCIDYSTINRLGLNDEESDGVVNYLMMPEGTEVAIYVREKSEGGYKVSLRSAGTVNVSDIAVNLGGGGHPNAAGYSIDDNLDSSKKKLLKMLELMLR